MNDVSTSNSRGLSITGLKVIVIMIGAALWLAIDFANGAALTVMLLSIGAVLISGSIAVAYGTKAKSKWGINFKPVVCPRCGAIQPRNRKPRTMQQFLWGGWTCTSCGTEIDKWGREIFPSKPN